MEGMWGSEKKGNLLNLKMGLCMKGNGLEIPEMVMVFKDGLMVLDMKVNGKIIKLMEKESFIMLIEMYLKANG